MKMKTKKTWMLGRMLTVVLMSGMLMGCPSDPEPDPPTLGLNPTSINFPKEQGVTRELRITTSNDATWMVYDSGWSEWLSLSTTSGKGSVTISLTTKNVNMGGSISMDLEVAAQNGGGEAWGKVKLTREPGMEEPEDWYLTVNGATTDTKNFGWEGESQNVKIETNDSWKASSSESWCKVSPVNAEYLTISVDKNTNEESSRQATVQIEGQKSNLVAIITVIQDPKNPDTIIGRDEYEDDKNLNGQGQTSYTLTVSPTTMTFVPDGEQQVATIVSNDTWTASSSQPWCALSSSNGANNGSVVITVSKNTTNDSRTAIVSVSGTYAETKTISITQEAYTLAVSPSALSLSSAGESATLAVTSNDSWTVTSDQSWCTILPSGGSGDGSIVVQAAANTSAYSRSATVTVRGTNSAKVVTVVVTQDVHVVVGRDEYGDDKKL